LALALALTGQARMRCVGYLTIESEQGGWARRCAYYPQGLAGT
jgi:hypothetical protein